jgi:hypothetical protein
MFKELVVEKSKGKLTSMGTCPGNNGEKKHLLL